MLRVCGVCCAAATALTPASGTTRATASLDPQHVRAWVYFRRPYVGDGVHPFTSATVLRELSEDECLVRVRSAHLSPIIEVGSRVYMSSHGSAAGPNTQDDTSEVIGATVGKVNSNGTLGVLLDDNRYQAQLKLSDVRYAQGRSYFTSKAEYAKLLEWVSDAGVMRHGDRDRLCCLLYQRGWHAADLHRLEKDDVMCMLPYMRRSVLQVVLEKVEWQRMHHDEMRALLRERVKEREWRYFVQKFSGFVSANWAGLGVLSVFLWNYKNFRKQQRIYQLNHAVDTLTNAANAADEEEAAAVELAALNSGPPSVPDITQDETAHIEPSHATTASSPGPGLARGQFVERAAEENWARQLLRTFDISRPRIVVLTGFTGCGKSFLFRSAVRKEHKPALFVEVRGHDDALGCMMKALRVPSLEACGDYLDFITDVFTEATRINGEPPVVVLTLREGSELSRVYNETALLACDRRLCHLVYEVTLESLTMANTSLPRLDFYTVPNFTPAQAMQYTEHGIDPVSLAHFIDVAGTNSNDIDELLAATHHRNVTATAYTNQKLAHAMRQVQMAWTGRPHIRAALKKLAEFDFTAGQRSGIDVPSLREAAESDVVFYDPVQDRWLFTHQLLHTAVRCCI